MLLPGARCFELSHHSACSCTADVLVPQLDLQLDAEAIAACLSKMPVTALLGLPEEYDLSRAADVQPPTSSVPSPTQRPRMQQAGQPAASASLQQLPSTPQQTPQFQGPAAPAPPAQQKSPSRKPDAAALNILQQLGLPSAAQPATALPARPAVHASPAQSSQTASHSESNPARDPANSAMPAHRRPLHQAGLPVEGDADLDELLGEPSPAPPPQAQARTPTNATPSGTQQPRSVWSSMPQTPSLSPQVPPGTDDFDDFLQTL